jgi:hypothetical protein
VHASIMLIVRKRATTATKISLESPAFTTGTPATAIPTKHLGDRPYSARSMMAHRNDFANPDCRRAMRRALEAVDLRHRRQWEIGAVVNVFLSRHSPKRRVMTALGLDALSEPLPSLLASLLVNVTVVSASRGDAFRGGFKMPRQEFERRVTIKTPPTLAHQAEAFAAMGPVDFLWSVVFASEAGKCQDVLVTMKNAMRALRPQGVAAFIVTVSISGPGIHAPTCALPFAGLLRYVEDLQALGYRVTAPHPAVALPEDRAEFDTEPYSAVDHMVFRHHGQLLTSALLVVENP